MKIYRYSQTETYSDVIHPKTSWHTTLQGATKELLITYPLYTEEQMDEDLEVVDVVVDLDEMWKENIDVRQHILELDEFDEYYIDKYNKSLPSAKEVQNRMREEVETLIDLGLD